jgi:hypothetical protein
VEGFVYANLMINPEIRAEARARAAACVATFDEAAALASVNGMRLLRHTDEHFRLIREKPRGIWNLYPRSGKRSPRIVGDPLHRGGFLALDHVDWTLLDVVQAAVALTQETAKTKAVAK